LLTPRAFWHVCGILLEAVVQAEHRASSCESMIGVMAISSHRATTTAGVVGGWCDVASGERDRERAEAAPSSSPVLSSIDRLERPKMCVQMSAIETDKKVSKTKYQKRV
jgi:hypothetical protein